MIILFTIIILLRVAIKFGQIFPRLPMPLSVNVTSCNRDKVEGRSG
jgi:hypothetical protein